MHFGIPSTAPSTTPHAVNNPVNNAITKAALAQQKREVAETVKLDGTLLDRVLSEQELLQKRDELSAPGTLLHRCIENGFLYCCL